MSDEPELRSGPPWAMQEMIEAEAGLPEPILASISAREAGTLVRDAIAAGEPVVVTGCGTSEHAARAGAELLREAHGTRRGIEARDAFEATLDPADGGVLVAISHEAGTEATLAAAAAAAERGARTVLVTAKPENAPDTFDVVVATPLADTSWCHTVGYLSPVLALLAIAAGSLVALPLAGAGRSSAGSRSARSSRTPPNASRSATGC